MTVNLSPVKLARREKILDAAESVFVSHGFRGATVELIAEAAAMSKVTVYGYFADKDAIFAAVTIRVAERIFSAVTDALALDGSLTFRISSALIGKHRLVYDLVRQSSFSVDLFSAKNRIVANRFRQLDDDIRALFTKEMVGSGLTDERAGKLSSIVFAASDGIASHAADFGDTSSEICEIVEAMLAR
jgi:AcrR family transcriptional regulator